MGTSVTCVSPGMGDLRFVAAEVAFSVLAERSLLFSCCIGRALYDLSTELPVMPAIHLPSQKFLLKMVIGHAGLAQV